ncbi:hypothetical protein [Halorarius litoreus]|uniref:hypothetical protein n=1 Tax=Halorarius litoreus TaxID=2962676 RepID=UPI0020CC6D2A|nr:hypothetical protein [Halorarius litoreus]
MRPHRLVLLVAALLLFATPALAHVPVFATDNATPETAYPITDASKSWSIYDQVDAGGVAYYELDFDAGDRLRVSVFTPSRSLTPSLVLASPALDESDAVPARVAVPDGYGREVVAGSRPDCASYEPFAPSSFYDTVQLDREVESGGRYLLVVYADGSGPVGLAVGQEERFTPTEYVRVPLDLVRVHLWEGQSPAVVFGPLVAVLGIGIALGRSRLPSARPASISAALGLAGLLYVGTAAGTALQTVIAVSRSGLTAGVLVTAVFVVVPLLLGAWLLRRAQAPAQLTTRSRLAALVVGVVGLATWAGLLVGPALLFAVAIAPKTGFGVGSGA